MKLFMYCLLPFVTMVVTAPITDSVTKQGSFTSQDPQSNSVEDNSEETTTTTSTTTSFTEMSEATSTESSDTNGFTSPEVSDQNGSASQDAIKDLDSDEIMSSKVKEEDEAPEASVDETATSSKQVHDQGSREQSGSQQASREPADLNSDEAENLSGQQDTNMSGDQVKEGKATPGGVHGLNGVLASGSREVLDRESLEDNDGKLAPEKNGEDQDYDETRESTSSETYPIEPPELTPSSFSTPAKSQDS